MVIQDLELEQLDVNATFLHRELEKNIYMQQAEGFEVISEENYVYLLKKSLYRSKQSPKQCYKMFDSFMIDHNFSKCSYDSCVILKGISMGYLYSYFYMLITC